MYADTFAGGFIPQTLFRASGVYLCLPCDRQFDYEPGHTNCPECKTDQRDDLAALYIEHDAEEAEWIQAFDFGEGD
jgi:hypothetical protein